MKKSISTIATLAILSASQGHAMYVMRCNAASPSGSYVPVLQVQTSSATTTMFMGSDGLTRKIFYKDRLALDYVSAALGLPKPHNLEEIAHCAGRPAGERNPDAGFAVDPDPVTPAVETPTVDEPTVEEPTVEEPTLDEQQQVSLVF